MLRGILVKMERKKRRIAMPLPSLEVLGTVRADGTLELDEKLNVPPGRVKVRVEAMPETAAKPAEGLVEFVDRLRREMEAAGHKFRTKEEIDAEIEELRNEWEERLDELDRASGGPSREEKPTC
jgi:hypothetical protein